MNSEILHGDCRNVLRDFPDNHFDSVCCDPPYELGFMGKKWDANGIAYDMRVWSEVFRVMKPGAHLAAFGGTRTYHRVACAIEDAGFEIRDSLHWLYGSGFPKSLDVSKAIDKAAGAEREVTGSKSAGQSSLQRIARVQQGYRDNLTSCTPEDISITIPSTPAAIEWSGWGTALKPAHEPIILARKPLAEKTVAANVLAHGTGALNIDASRVGTTRDVPASLSTRPNDGRTYGKLTGGQLQDLDPNIGRFPPNILLTHSPDCDGECAPGCPVAGLDGQSGTLTSSRRQLHHDIGRTQQATYGKPSGRQYTEDNTYGDSGGASRFYPQFTWDPEYDLPFLYCAKTPKKERPSIEGMASHPTVKPLALMRWLVRLITPSEGIVLDPFAGTGTTGQAARDEGFRYVLIEREPDYIKLINKRLYREPTLFDMEDA
jgi:site-specific DNA-methyltransferase (adenine-specific)